MRKLIPIITTLILVFPLVVFGQVNYMPLIQLPIGDGKNATWQDYIDLLYTTSISVAALLAVIKIVIAGAKYMFSDVITDKGSAIKDIKGALLGLLLIIGAVLILELINPRLITGGLKLEQVRPAPALPAVPPIVPVKPGEAAPNSTKLGTETQKGSIVPKPKDVKPALFEISCSKMKGVPAGEGDSMVCKIPTIITYDKPPAARAGGSTVIKAQDADCTARGGQYRSNLSTPTCNITPK
jgi:hypothetical protein